MPDRKQLCFTCHKEKMVTDTFYPKPVVSHCDTCNNDTWFAPQ